MTGLSHAERLALADALVAAGPGAPTLCSGWTSADLAAHLVMRERRPDGAVGILAAPLAPYSERVRTSIRDGSRYAALVESFRSGPPWWSPTALPGVDATANLLEFFVHHEDVRRARDGWEPRALEPELERALWQRLVSSGRLLGRRAPVGIVLRAPGFGEAAIKAGPDPVTISGRPGELVLFLFGRGSQARVELTGGPEGVRRLRESRLGM